MIHRYKLGGFYIVLDVCSGAVHVVDELSYELLGLLTPPLAERCPQEVLEALQRWPAQEVEECYRELCDLWQAGQLFSEDDYDQFERLMVNSPIKAMCLHVSHDCNLRCEYCFASTGDYGEGRRNMSAETGRQAIDFLIRHSGGRRNLELDFFGGEPLLNFEVVKEIVRYGREQEKLHNKHFRFTITTNGMLLDDEKIAFINQEMYNVVLSIDGRPEVNDRVRHRVDGTGSYAAILPRFRRLVEARGEGQYYVRGTFTKYNMDFAQDVLHLNEAGFDQISVEPVVADPALPYALTEEDLPAIFAEYERLAQLLVERKRAGQGFNFFHFMVDLDQGPCAIKRLRGCGCGNEYVAVTPDGDIYPCHQFVGQEEWKMGTLASGEVDQAMKERFAHATVYGKPECKRCWAKFYCSGGCNANNMQYGGDITQPVKLSCELEKKRLECAIMIKAALAE